MDCKLQMRRKGDQECRFDVKDGEVFKVLKKIGEKGRVLRTASERGQFGDLQRELVAFPSITWYVKRCL